jgi:hypothetical protein
MLVATIADGRAFYSKCSLGSRRRPSSVRINGCWCCLASTRCSVCGQRWRSGVPLGGSDGHGQGVGLSRLVPRRPRHLGCSLAWFFRRDLDEDVYVGRERARRRRIGDERTLRVRVPCCSRNPLPAGQRAGGRARHISGWCMVCTRSIETTGGRPRQSYGPVPNFLGQNGGRLKL